MLSILTISDFGNPLPYLLMDVKWENCNNDTVFRLLGQTGTHVIANSNATRFRLQSFWMIRSHISLPGIPALGGFVLLDLTFLTLFTINEWVVRLYVIREKHWKYAHRIYSPELALFVC